MSKVKIGLIENTFATIPKLNQKSILYCGSQMRDVR